MIMFLNCLAAPAVAVWVDLPSRKQTTGVLHAGSEISTRHPPNAGKLLAVVGKNCQAICHFGAQENEQKDMLGKVSV